MTHAMKLPMWLSFALPLRSSVMTLSGSGSSFKASTAAPVLVAYGLTAGVPLYFYPLLPLFLFGFVLLPGSVSAIACLLFMRYMPRNRKQVLVVIGAIFLAALGYWIIRTTTVSTVETFRRSAGG